MSTVAHRGDEGAGMDYHPRPPVVTVSALDAVLAAYRQILDTPDVTADDDFFELGGDSIQAMNIIALVQEMIGAEISVGMFFTYPTAAELATAITPLATRS